MVGTDYIECDKRFTLFDRINAITNCSMVAYRSLWPMTMDALKFGLFGLPVGVGLHVAVRLLGPSASGHSFFVHGELIWGVPALVFAIAWLIYFFVDFLLPRRINRRLREAIADLADDEPEEIHYPAQFRFSYKGHMFESNCNSFTTSTERQSYQRHRFLTLSYYYRDKHYKWRTYEGPLFQSCFREYSEFFSHDSQRLMANIALKRQIPKDAIADCLDKLTTIVDEQTVKPSVDVLTSNFPTEVRTVRLDHATLTFDGTACTISMTKADRLNEMADRLFSTKFLVFVGFSFTFACAFLNSYAFSLFILICALSYVLIVFLMKDLCDLSNRTIPYEDLEYMILDEDDGYLTIEYKSHTIPRSLHYLIEKSPVDELKNSLPPLSKHIEKTVAPRRRKYIWLAPFAAGLFSVVIFFILKSFGDFTRASLPILILSVFIWLLYAISDFIDNKDY